MVQELSGQADGPRSGRAVPESARPAPTPWGNINPVKVSVVTVKTRSRCQVLLDGCK